MCQSRDPHPLSTSHRDPLVPTSNYDSLEGAAVWYDFFGIPQVKDRLVDDASSEDW